MMKKRLFAFLTALCCGASVMAMPAFAQDETLPVHEYIVIGVDDSDNSKDVIILEYGTDRQLYLTQEQIELYLAEGDRTPRYGDKLTVKGNVTWTELAGTNYMQFDFDDPYEITNEGSIYSETVEEKFVVTLGKNLPHVVYLSPLDDSEVHYHYYSDVFTRLGYSQPKGFDWNEVETGDEVIFRTYEGCPVFPVGVPSTDFIVIGVDNEENPQNYIVYHPAAAHAYTCYLTATQVETFLNEGEPQPAYGDILEISGDLLITEIIGTNSMMFIDEMAEPVTEKDSKHGIDVTGNVLANEERETYCIQVSETIKNAFRLSYETDPETGATKSYAYYHDAFIYHGYVQPDGIDLENIGTGDEMTFLMYNGFPVIPTAISRLGDANADGALSIVDVVMVNRHVMGADMTSTTMNTDAADFDKNGEVTHEDSLSILKRLVGLV